jgi:hypothetical protein
MTKALLILAMVTLLAGCGPKERLVELRESDQPLLSEPSDFTIVFRGKVVDMDTRAEIPDAEGLGV